MNDFLNYNSHCPLCGNKLSLYLSFIGDKLFKFQDNKFQDIDIGYMTYPFKPNNDAFCILSNNKDLLFSSRELAIHCEQFDIFFFFMCNDAGISRIYSSEVEVSPFDACYYRSSDICNITNNSNELIQQNPNIINRDEIACYKEDLDVNIINISYEEKLIRFWTYKYNSSNDILEKEFDLSNKKLNLSDREAMFKKFSLWKNLS